MTGLWETLSDIQRTHENIFVDIQNKIINENNQILLAQKNEVNKQEKEYDIRNADDFNRIYDSEFTEAEELKENFNVAKSEVYGDTDCHSEEFNNECAYSLPEIECDDLEIDILFDLINKTKM